MSALLALVLAANPFLAEALEHEKNLDFEKCVARLKQASTQWKNTPEESRDVELHAGLCQFNLGRRNVAAEHFRVALRIDEATDLPPYTSPKAVELFLEVKRALQPPPPPLPDEDLPDDRPLAKPRLEPQTAAPEPAPVSAFLTRRAAPLSLGAVTLASAAVGLALGLRAQALTTQANAARFESDFYALGTQARGFATGANLAWVLSAASAIATVVTWWVTGTPATTP